jgi:hypothetical protein
METMEKKTKSTKFTLPKKRLEIEPIKRKGAWLPDYHEASFLFGEAKFTFVVKRDHRTGRYVDPLTAEERAYSESAESRMPFTGGELNINNPKEPNWWLKQTFKIGKDKKILDLSDENDYLMYKLLLTNTDLIAPSADAKFKRGTYKYALVDVEEVEKDQAKDAYSKIEAYELLAKMKNSSTKLIDFLRAYYWDKPGKNVAPNSKKEWLVNQVTEIVDNDTRGFLTLLQNADYDYRVIIEKALLAGALDRRKTNYYLPEDPNPVASNLLELIEFFKNKKNQETVLTIQARIDNSTF